MKSFQYENIRPLSSFPQLTSSTHRHPGSVGSYSAKKDSITGAKKKKEWKRSKEKKKLKVWVGVAGKCKKRPREVSHAKEGEWGNIFHFLFPSSRCQGINHYPLKLIPALCKAIGENRRGGLCTVDPAECDEMGLNIVENGGNRSPLKMQLWVHTPLFG